MNRTAVLFPGQGAQALGMGQDFVNISAAAREVYAQADEILGYSLSDICFRGPAQRLNTTDISQPAIFVTSIAIWRALESAGMTQDLNVQAMAGLSLGEYTALHLAGWFDFETGLRLVARRGRLMQDASEAIAGGMVSVMGMDEKEVLELCEEASGDEILVPANFNCPGQIVLSGTQAACRRAETLAGQHGARAIPLAVAGAFHSPLMESAVEGLTTALSASLIKQGEIGVVSNVSSDYHGNPKGVRALLRDQVAKPIRWQASIERLIEEGFDRFVEVGPGRVLTGLMRKINRAVKVQNYSKASLLGSVTV